MQHPKRILVCPMDWGLGHATRMVPVIRLLQASGVEVVLGADGNPLSFLRSEFPQLSWIRIPGFVPRYQKKGSLLLKMAFSIPRMLKEARKAHNLLEQIILEEKISAVISDNRYELWSEKIPTVFITHQLHILLPFFLSFGQPLVKTLMYRFIRKYNELWIPDFEKEPSLSGILSHRKNMPVKNYFYIGPLSRFTEKSSSFSKSETSPDILCMLSGPEPQRSVFEHIMLEQLKKNNLHSILLRGKPDETTEWREGNCLVLPHASDEKLLQLMLSARTIVCRAGYSSIMDLVSIGRSAILVPTPGQPEQEFLARKLKKEGVFYSCSQNEFSLEKAVTSAKKYKVGYPPNDFNMLKQRIKVLLQSLDKNES